jgi:hypothetical protein
MKIAQIMRYVIGAVTICLFILEAVPLNAQSLPLRIRPEAIVAGDTASSLSNATDTTPTPAAGATVDVPRMAMLDVPNPPETTPDDGSTSGLRWVAQIDPSRSSGSGYPAGTNPPYPPGAGSYPNYSSQPSGSGTGVSSPTAQFDNLIEPSSGASASPSDASLPPGIPERPNTFMGEVSQGFEPVVSQVNNWREQALRERIVLDYTYIPGGSKANSFGIHDIDLQARFKFPAWSRLVDSQSPMATPLYLTPGFSFNLLDWPTGLPPLPGPLPNSVFGAYLDTEWNPRLGPALATELSLRIGVYSDFKKLNSDSLQIRGRAVGVLTIQEDAIFLKAGVIYLGREHVSLLPTVGLVFMPTSDTRFDLVFPDPKLAVHLNTLNTVDVWGYLRAEYGGGSWTIDMGGSVIQADYNDVRIAVGLEFQDKGENLFDGHFELGYAVDREIYTLGAPLYEPDSMIFVGAGLSF